MIFTRMGARIAAIAVAVAVTATTLSVVDVSPDDAVAADLSAFDPGFIITDEIFFDGSAMGADAVQRFLDAKSPACVNYTSNGTVYTCLKNFTSETNSRPFDEGNCAAYVGRAKETAAQIIANVGKACGVNPQAILTTLQKEQGLVTSSARSSAIYRKAMGYGCPDTAQCDSKYYGFFNQVYSAAWQFKQYGISTNFRYQAGKTTTVQFHPNTSCGGRPVYLRNRATAALYNYTPYQPNAASLAAAYGPGDSCSSYGNRNFYNYFSDWFGNPGNLLRNPGFSSGEAHWNSGATGSISMTAKTDANLAQSGSRYLLASAPEPGRRVQQVYSKSIAPGSFYSGGVWLRAATAGTTASGRVLIQTVGGTREVAIVPFTVGSDAWQFVELSLPVERSGHTGLAVEVELAAANTRVMVDTAELYLADSGLVPRLPIKAEQIGVKSGVNGGWVPSTNSGLTLRVGSTKPVFGRYLSIASSATGDSVSQTIPRATRIGTSYTAGFWVRSTNPAVPLTGRMSLSTVGGNLERATTDFTATGTWTYLTTTLYVAKGSHSGLRLQIFPDTRGASFNIDEVTLAPTLSNGTSWESSTQSLILTPPSTTVARVSATEMGAPATDGRFALEVSRDATGGGWVQTEVVRRLGSSDRFTAGVWVKSADPGVTYAGTLQLQARRGSDLEFTNQPFVANDRWQFITVKHSIKKQRLNALRVIVKLDAPVSHLYLDGMAVR